MASYTVRTSEWNKVIKYYETIEDSLDELQTFVAFDKRNEHVFSAAINDLLQKACSELETVLKHLCLASQPGDRVEKWSFPELFYHLSSTGLLNANVVLVFDKRWPIVPFNRAVFEPRPSRPTCCRYTNPRKPVVWWSAHNKTKHKRFDLFSSDLNCEFKKANFINTINAIGALYIAEMKLAEVLGRTSSLNSRYFDFGGPQA